jgi:chaperonin GroEL
MKEKKMRVDDAVNATRAAAQEGIVAGGGVALVRASRSLDKLAAEDDDADVRTGIRLLRRAMEEPLRRIAENAGVDGSIVINRVDHSKGKQGYNAATGEFEDLAAAGIIDPTKVVRTALQNAASVAGLLLTTDAAVTDAPEPKKAAAAPQMHGGEDYDF